MRVLKLSFSSDNLLANIQQGANMTTTHTYFMMLKTTTAWLAMTEQQRFAYLGSAIKPILDAHPAVSLRFYDSEFYSARVTDIAVWETADPKAWQMLVEALREQPFWGQYFDIVELIPAVENAYASNYDRKPVQAS
jgi:Darcynin, domain of unknown function